MERKTHQRSQAEMRYTLKGGAVLGIDAGGREWRQFTSCRDLVHAEEARQSIAAMHGVETLYGPVIDDDWGPIIPILVPRDRLDENGHIIKTSSITPPQS